MLGHGDSTTNNVSNFTGVKANVRSRLRVDQVLKGEVEVLKVEAKVLGVALEAIL
jgi:hypothetical protein